MANGLHALLRVNRARYETWYAQSIRDPEGFWELHERVCQCANALSVLGVQKGDRVTIYLPMIPECCTRPAATWCTRHSLTKSSSIYASMMSSGVRPMSVGSLATAT